MKLLAIDPGFRESGWLFCETEPFKIIEKGISPNDALLHKIIVSMAAGPFCDVVVIEHISMGGMIAGQETFDTCFIAGRLAQAAAPMPFCLLKRIRVKLHLCGNARAKDSNVRQALLDRFGGSLAVGTKKAQGPLYGVRKHIWSALALAVTYADMHRGSMAPRENGGDATLDEAAPPRDGSSGVPVDRPVAAGAGGSYEPLDKR